MNRWQEQKFMALTYIEAEIEKAKHEIYKKSIDLKYLKKRLKEME